jgi:hypothetical protein
VIFIKKPVDTRENVSITKKGSSSTNQNQPGRGNNFNGPDNCFFTLQRTIGNHAILQLLQDSTLLQRQQAKPSNAQAAIDEANSAIKQMYGIIHSTNTLNAEYEFTFWTSNGAMTLVNFKQTQPGTKPVQPVDEATFTRGFGTWLPVFIGQQERYYKIILQRESANWGVKSQGETQPASQPSLPPEGRSIPLSTSGVPAPTFIKGTEIVKQIGSLLHVPQNGRAEANFSVEYDDDRLEKLEIGTFTWDRPKTGSKDLPPQPLFVDVELLNSILAFTGGLGNRTVTFKLNGIHSGSPPYGVWHVTEAGVKRPPTSGMPDEADKIVSDYRRMHQDIIVQWRQGVKDMAVYAAMMGAEQIALWLIGGAIFKLLGASFRLVAPRLLGFIGKGTQAGLEYLETMIVRLSTAEKAELRAIIKKAETEGMEALSAIEKQRLIDLMTKLESLIGKPLVQAEKDAIRDAMVARYGAARAATVEAFKKAGLSCPIHHRFPLEWSHLFPQLDVNAAKNLIGLETTVHQGVNAVWTRFRTLPAAKVKGEYVVKIVEIVDKYFGKWYHTVPQNSGAALTAEVATAKSSALAEVDALIQIIK